MGTSANIATLVAAAQRGDEVAFGELYRRFARMVHGLLLARLAPEDAKDVAQEVFLQAFRRLAALREAAAFGGWIATLARNAAVDHLRKPQRRFERETLSEEMPAMERTDHAGDALRILAVIRSLPEAYSETLLLRLVEGMTGAEIAATTGLTPDSVRVNLSRGMKKLRARLAERGVAG